MASRDVRWCTNWCTGAWHAPHAPRSDESSRALADAGSCPGNCAGMEEATGAPSSFTAHLPRRLRASGRDRGSVMIRPPSPLTMLFSRHTRRREFITLLGGAAVTWPLAARPQQVPVPLIGFMSSRSSVESGYLVAAFRKGLSEEGYIEGRNVAIEF